MKTEYKYHLFYLIHNDDDVELYAYTDDKKIAKRFKEERDMNKFICKVHYCNTTDIKRLHDEYPSCNLAIADGNTKERSQGSKKIKISLVMTSDEYHSIISEYDSLINVDFQTFARYSPLIFKKEIKHALKYIDYYRWYELFEAGESDVGMDYDIDIFEAFMVCYGKLLGGVEE